MKRSKDLKVIVAREVLRSQPVLRLKLRRATRHISRAFKSMGFSGGVE